MAANPLSSTPLAARFRCISTNIRLNRSARGAALANFRFREFLRRRLLGERMARVETRLGDIERVLYLDPEAPRPQ